MLAWKPTRAGRIAWDRQPPPSSAQSSLPRGIGTGSFSSLVDAVPILSLVTQGQFGAGAYPGSPVLGLLGIPVALGLGGYLGSLMTEPAKR